MDSQGEALKSVEEVARFNAWPRAFATAWPIAIVLSLGVGKLSFKLAAALARRAD